MAFPFTAGAGLHDISFLEGFAPATRLVGCAYTRFAAFFCQHFGGAGHSLCEVQKILGYYDQGNYALCAFTPYCIDGCHKHRGQDYSSGKEETP